MVRLRRYEVENTPFFITTQTYRNQKFFLNKDRAEIVIDYIYRAKEKMIDFLLAFVVMPEHFHLLIVPESKYSISQVMLFVKKGSSRVIHNKENTNGHLWAKRFFDRGIRSEQELFKTIEYIHNNPIKRGLAVDIGDYPFSSASSKLKTDLEVYFARTE
jgi:putative transposase